MKRGIFTVKRINGSWIEFTHHNKAEGVYYTPMCRSFTDEQWRVKIREMNKLGMKYLFLLCTSLVYADSAEAYFETDIYPFAENFMCRDPIEVLLDEADKCNMKVFLSVGYYGDCYHAYANMISEEVKSRSFRAMEQLYSLFGHHKSFYGWYLPDEVGADPRYPEEFISYVNGYSAFAHTLCKSHKIFISPYGTRGIIADDSFVKTLEALDADFIAYQDEVGVMKSTPEETPRFFENIKKAHDKAGRASLWANVETFSFEGVRYRSPLIPSTPERLYDQLKGVSDYADEVVCYEYIGMMNEPGTIAYCGHPDSINYYLGYKKLLDEGKIR